MSMINPLAGKTNSLSHLIFFSLPANIIWPYYLSMTAAFAILFADLVGDKEKLSKYLAYFSVAFVSIVLASSFYFTEFWPSDTVKSGKNIIECWKKENPKQDSQLNYFSTKRLFSLEFYSSGHSKQIKTDDEIRQMIQNKSMDYLIMNKHDFKKLPEDITQHFSELYDNDDSKLHLVLLKKID